MTTPYGDKMTIVSDPEAPAENRGWWTTWDEGSDYAIVFAINRLRLFHQPCGQSVTVDCDCRGPGDPSGSAWLHVIMRQVAKHRDECPA